MVFASVRFARYETQSTNKPLGLELSFKNMTHRLATAIVLACKYCDETYYTNLDYAKLLAPAEHVTHTVQTHKDNIILNKMEKEMLYRLDYRLYFTTEELENFVQLMLECFQDENDNSLITKTLTFT